MKHGHLNAGRSALALEIKCRNEFLKEYLMSARQYKQYWNDKNATLFGGVGSFSKWLKFKKEQK